MRPSRQKQALQTLWIFFFCIAVVGANGAPFDLSRITPVPADEAIPTMDFFRPLLLQEPTLNPSGTHIAAIVTAEEDKHRLLVYELGTQKIEMVGGSGDKDVYSAHWLNDRRLVFELSSRKLYGLGLLAANVGKLDKAYPLLQYYGTRLIAVPTNDRLSPLVWNRYDSITARRDIGCALINSSIGTGRMVDLTAVDTNMTNVEEARENNEKHISKTYPVPESGSVQRYIANGNGELEFAVTWDNGLEQLFRLVSDHWEKCPVDLNKVVILGAGETPGQLLIKGPRQPGKPRPLQFLDGVTGELGEVLLQDDTYDFFSAGLSSGWVYRDPKTKKIVGAGFERRGPQTFWFNEAYRSLQKILDGYFPGLVVRIISGNEAQTRFLVATFSDRQPTIYSWVDLEKRTTGLIKKSRPWIDPQRMQPMNMIKYKTLDGRQLDAYLTLPAGASKKNPPALIVLPHGGPWARDGWSFDGEVQFLASRGYAVLQPNYRGSHGYDWMFPNADRFEFRKMHDDVTAATKTLIKSGLIDKDRIAIMGGSFGGYLAVSGVAHEPNLYRCAVTIAGVFDWGQQIKDKKYDQYDTTEYSYLVRKLGDPNKNPEMFDAISPLRHASQIRVPIFVSAGKEDKRVELNQAEALISTLKKHDLPHETLLVGAEGHGMAHLSNQVKLYERIAAFLEKNLKCYVPRSDRKKCRV